MKKVILLFVSALIFGACDKEAVLQDIPSSEEQAKLKGVKYKVVITKTFTFPFTPDLVLEIATFNNVVDYSIEGANSDFYFEDEKAYDAAIADLDATSQLYFTYPGWLCIMFEPSKLPLDPPLEFEITEMVKKGYIPEDPINSIRRDLEESENIED
ncbi:hypothetical protein Barb4_01855 [Bacteroidales bacterium Barb4]|nr:hypothetical protein Barb4_01855 [Bacteroidales bacterium Barb4]